jgi:hypothetical protein
MLESKCKQAEVEQPLQPQPTDIVIAPLHAAWLCDKKQIVNQNQYWLMSNDTELWEMILYGDVLWRGLTYITFFFGGAGGDASLEECMLHNCEGSTEDTVKSLGTIAPQTLKGRWSIELK